MGFTKKEMESQGFTPEQIEWAMAERGKEINTSKAELEKVQAELSARDKTISELSEKVKTFDGKEEILKSMQDKVALLEKEKLEREESEKQAKLNSELLERFNKAKGESKFAHELVEKGRFEEFKAAISSKDFEGKGDSDIYTALVKPEDLVNPQKQTVTMPGGGGGIPQDLTKARNYEEYKAMRKM